MAISTGIASETIPAGTPRSVRFPGQASDRRSLPLAPARSCSKRSWLWLLAGILLLAAPKSASALYLAEDVFLWEGGVVPVCWDPRIEPESAVPKAIRARVESSWGYYGNITFAGWGRCPAASVAEMPNEHIVFIQGTSGEPNTDPHEGRSLGSRGETPRPTVINLNFDQPWKAGCDLGPGGNTAKECTVWQAVHEFGHVLGFVHEHARPDFPGCTFSFPFPKNWWDSLPVIDVFEDKQPGFALTAYDPNSVMNYCSRGAGTNEGRLTRLDIVGLQLVS